LISNNEFGKKLKFIPAKEGSKPIGRLYEIQADIQKNKN